jgi:hypothetical protein
MISILRGGLISFVNATRHNFEKSKDDIGYVTKLRLQRLIVMTLYGHRNDFMKKSDIMSQSID